MNVFICYRRDDAAWVGRLTDALERLGVGGVFVDYLAFEVGDFTAAIEAMPVSRVAEPIRRPPAACSLHESADSGRVSMRPLHQHLQPTSLPFLGTLVATMALST